MSNQFTIRAAPLPPNFKGTFQEAFEAMLDRMEVVTSSDVFQTLDYLPASNEGAVLLGGKKWYVWDETTSAYIPLDISDSETLEIVISETAPATSPPRVWFKTLATEFLGVYIYMGSTAGWVEMDRELVTNSITTDMLQNGVVTTDKLAAGAVTMSNIAGQIPLSKITVGLARQVMKMNAGASAAVWEDQSYASAEVDIVGGAGGTENTVYTKSHTLGVAPRHLEWVLVCKTDEEGWEVGDEISALSALDSNDADKRNADYRNATEVGLIARRTMQIPYKDGTDRFLITPANWKLKAYYSM